MKTLALSSGKDVHWTFVVVKVSSAGDALKYDNVQNLKVNSNLQRQ